MDKCWKYTFISYITFIRAYIRRYYIYTHNVHVHSYMSGFGGASPSPTGCLEKRQSASNIQQNDISCCCGKTLDWAAELTVVMASKRSGRLRGTILAWCRVKKTSWCKVMSIPAKKQCFWNCVFLICSPPNETFASFGYPKWILVSNSCLGVIFKNMESKIQPEFRRKTCWKGKTKYMYGRWSMLCCSKEIEALEGWRSFKGPIRLNSTTYGNCRSSWSGVMVREISFERTRMSKVTLPFPKCLVWVKNLIGYDCNFGFSVPTCIYY